MDGDVDIEWVKAVCDDLSRGYAKASLPGFVEDDIAALQAALVDFYLIGIRSPERLLALLNSPVVNRKLNKNRSPMTLAEAMKTSRDEQK